MSYPPQPPGGYPPQPGQPGGYPPQPGAPGGYPPQPGAPGGYPPQPGGYPPQPGYGHHGMGNVYGAPGSDGFGRDTLFGNAPIDSTDSFALQNSKMLKVTLSKSGIKELYAKSGSMIAYQGGVSFDGNSRSWAQHLTSALTGQGLPLMKVHGAGTVYFANQAQDLFILELKGDSFTIDKDNLLAFSPDLRWDVVRVDSQQQIGGMNSFNVELSGHGTFVASSQGAPLVMDVTPTSYYFADADAVLGWTSDLAVSMQAAVTTSSSVWKPRGNTGEGWQMSFSGEGQVIVQPAEMLPPYMSIATNAQGVPQLGELGNLLGMGSGGLAGNNPFGGRR